MCENNPGSFICKCKNHFVLADDGVTCNGMYTNMSIYDTGSVKTSLAFQQFVTKSIQDLVLLIPNLALLLYKIINNKCLNVDVSS